MENLARQASQGHLPCIVDALELPDQSILTFSKASACIVLLHDSTGQQQAIVILRMLKAFSASLGQAQVVLPVTVVAVKCLSAFALHCWNCVGGVLPKTLETLTRVLCMSRVAGVIFPESCASLVCKKRHWEWSVSGILKEPWLLGLA